MEIGSKTAEKNSAQTNKQTDRHYENNAHLVVNQFSYMRPVYQPYHSHAQFLANVNSRSRSLFAVACPSVVCLSARAPYSGACNFRQ